MLLEIFKSILIGPKFPKLFKRVRMNILLKLLHIHVDYIMCTKGVKKTFQTGRFR